MKYFLASTLILIALVQASSAYAVGGSETIGAQPGGLTPGTQKVAPTSDSAIRAESTRADTGQSVVGKECSSYSDPFSYGFCYLGGQLFHAFDGIFTVENIFWLLSVISYATFRLSGILLGLGTWWLDGAVYYTVVLMGAFINFEPKGAGAGAQGIKLAWSLVRDIANISIIAGFVAVGISTILGIAQYAADKFLARLIIAALLVNFSYFITGAIIDATNYVSVQIYYSDILTEGCSVGSQTSTARSFQALGTAAATGNICSIGSSFMKHSNLSSWDKLQGIALNSVGAKPQGAVSDSTNTSGLSALQTKDLYYWLFVLGILGTIFNLLTGFVFIMAAGLLIIRFAALIIVLVTSPIGIAGINVPFLDAYVGRWWSALTSQAVFAPVYFILVGIGLLVMKNFAEFMNTNGKSFADALGKNAADPALGILTGNLPLFIVFFVGLAFMYAALMFAREIASSVPELKGLYDLGKDYMWSAYTGPAKLGRLGVSGLAHRTLIPDLEDLAASRNPRGITARALTGFSSLLRGIDKIGKKQGEKAKTSAEEAAESVTDKRNNRYAPDLNKILGGRMKQSAFSNPLKSAPFWKEKGKRTPEEDKKIKEALHGIDKDKINETLSKREVEQGLLHDDFTDEQKEAIFRSHGYSDKEKHAFVYAFLESKGIKTDKDGKIDGADAAKRLDTLTEVERKILLAERAELLDDKEFLSTLKSKNYDDIRKGQPLDSRRSEGLAIQLKSSNPDVVRGALGRMSDSEKAKLDYETVKAASKHMSAAERNHIYRNTRDENIKKHLREEHGADLSGTGPGRNPDEAEGTPPPADDKK